MSSMRRRTGGPRSRHPYSAPGAMVPGSVWEHLAGRDRVAVDRARAAFAVALDIVDEQKTLAHRQDKINCLGPPNNRTCAVDTSSPIVTETARSDETARHRQKAPRSAPDVVLHVVIRARGRSSR